jgi:hypothetical protein
MRHRFAPPLALAVAIFVAGGPALAQKPDRVEGAAAQGPPAAEGIPTVAAAAAAQKLLPEVKVENISLADLINNLREADPSFQAVVAYAPGVEPPGPVVQELKLKNVTAQSVLDVLQQVYPFLEIRTVRVGDERQESEVKTVVVNRDNREKRPASGRVTSVLRIREIVDDLEEDEGRKDVAGARDRARSAVLSLLQAALQTTEPAGSSLKVHEATDTVVFSGTGEQAVLVQETVQTLKRPRDKEVAAAVARAEKAEAALRQLEKLKQELVHTRLELDITRRDRDKMKAELDTLRQRVQKDAPPAPQPQPKPQQ